MLVSGDDLLEVVSIGHHTERENARCSMREVEVMWVVLDFLRRTVRERGVIRTTPRSLYPVLVNEKRFASSPKGSMSFQISRSLLSSYTP